ncbi:MAG: DUF4338 domain-containing protein, partial [Clostridiales bacterium]|nr:DUF4338 domain-containing protein [Clostridiales bacterium]
MDNTIRVFSGRAFCPEDINLVKWVIKTYPKLSVTELASTICEILDWTTPAGGAKKDPCIAFLGQFESEGLIKLPSKMESRIRSGSKSVTRPDKIDFDTTEIIGDINSLKPIRLVIARPGEDLNRWRSYVDQYYMLGFKRMFGSRLQYFIKSGDLELGCIQFSASSWALKDRDDWIDWSIDDKKQRLNLIVNNSRYLIFPWVHIPNLASKALSLSIKQIQRDWLCEFCYAPVLLGTFVDKEHFEGTCYKASNWLYLGQTKGQGRNNRDRKQNRSKKDIYE